MEGSALVPRLDLKVVRGYPLLRYFADNMPQVDKWEARADDLLVSTYPKSGTTWISEVIDMLFNEGDTKKCKRDVILKRVPFLEFATPGCQSGPELLAETPSPRVVKTHLPVKLLPPSLWEKNCKMIYVARNAKDVAVSFYHFYGISKLHPDPGTWDDFLNKFMAGTVSYGSWYEHVKEWWDRAQKYRILYLFYEDMQEDPRREIRKVATFLGMDVGDDIVEKINTHTAFKQMKDNPMANYDGVHPLVVDLTLGPFMRKGITGDWKNHFTEAQNKRFDEDYKRQMSGTTLRFRTEV